MFWLVVATTFVIGLLLGALTRTRIVLLSLPPLAIATVYWVAVGWNGDDYDIGRSGLILFTAFFGVAFLTIWVVGSVVGRLMRVGFERPSSSHPAGS
jgi:hypothetical protein